MMPGFLSVLDKEEVVPLPNNREVGGHIKDEVEVLDVGFDVVLDRLEILPLLDVDLCNLLVFVEHDVEIDVHLLKLGGVGGLQVVVLLLTEASEPEGSDLELEVGRLGVAAVVEGNYFAGVGCLLVDGVHQIKAFQLPRPCILLLIGVVQFDLVGFVVVLVQ